MNQYSYLCITVATINWHLIFGKKQCQNHKIIAIESNDLIEAGGALHCVTKEIGAY